MIASITDAPLGASLTLVEKLRLARRRLGLSAKQAAELWGLKLSVLRSYEIAHRPTPTKRTRNATLLRRIVAKQEAQGGVLHPLWQPTNCQTLNHTTRKSNDYRRKCSA
jgi:hypothetical protein